VTNGTTTHILPLLTDRGLSTQVGTLALTFVGLAMFAGRILGGYLVDRFFAPYITACSFLVPLVGIVLLCIGSAALFPLLGAICVGLGLGSEIALMGFLIGRYFGLRGYGEIYGYLMAAFLVGAGLGAWIMGACFDATHSYDLAFIGFGLSLIVASVLVCRLGPYVYPCRVLPRDIEPSLK
jgi:predicted MFS family arabinose efflux permease